MPRNVATSLAVHQSRGSGSATVATPQRLRCLIPACACRCRCRGRHRLPPGKVFDLVTTAELWPQWAVLARAMAGVTERPFQLGDPHSRVRPHPDRRAGNRVAHHRARPAPPRQVAGRGRLARGGRGRAALPPGGGDAAPADALPVPDASDLDLAQVRASAARATASATASRSMSPLRRPAVVVGT